ncbi:ANLN (predicted) [Pycnogonum litorale]
MDQLNHPSSRKRRTPFSENISVLKQPSGEDKKRQCTSSDDENSHPFDEKDTTLETENAVPELNEESSTDASDKVSKKGKSRFAALAATINQWEDQSLALNPSYKNNFNVEVKNKNSKLKNSEKSPRKADVVVEADKTVTPPASSNERRCDNIPPAPPIMSPVKSISNKSPIKKASVWDKAVVATLEAQGFTKSPSASKISYDYKNGKNSSAKQVTTPRCNHLTSSNVGSEKKLTVDPVVNSATLQSPCKEPMKEASRKISVSDRVAMFSKPTERKARVDPCLLSISDRVALFENAMDTPSKPRDKDVHFTSKEMGIASKATDCVTTVLKNAEKVTVKSPLKSKDNVDCASPSKINSSPLTKNIHQKLATTTNTWKSNEISEKSKAERQQEMSDLRNRWEKSSCVNKSEKLATTTDVESSECDQNSQCSEEPEQEDSLVDQLSNVSDTCSQLSDSVEDVDTYNEETADDTGADNQYDGDISDDAAEACGEIDRMLDEAIENEDYEDEESSHSLERSPLPPPPPPPPPQKSQVKRSPSPVKQHLPTHVDGGDETLPLMHTVSFYRRQKEVNKTPVRKVVRRESVCSPPSPSKNISLKQASIQQRIKLLQEDVNTQQTIISQTSQALNLCRSTTEFYGSSEQIEGERLLLIATQRRQACMNEITRLKTEGAMIDVKCEASQNESEGVLTISDIRLPLKKAFVVATAEGQNADYVHNFLCLIRHGGQIIATEMLTTQQGIISSGSLSFSNMITIHNLGSDFNVVIEVYGLQCPKESLSHDRKYHIKKDSSRRKLTPKKKQESKLLMSPAIASPGGPLAVRSSSFAIIGYVKLCLKNLSRKVFMLEKVPHTSPLEGNVYLKVQCHADLRCNVRGFLTMFEDVSGFGAWHRRWCVLTGQQLAYWKYPDDEKRKEPIGYIDLRKCITDTVGVAPRDVCARLNTFLMVTMRPRSEDDEEDLITRKCNTVTTKKHLLSADSKEERVWWCEKINKALTNIRKWDPQAMHPVQ